MCTIRMVALNNFIIIGLNFLCLQYVLFLCVWSWEQRAWLREYDDGNLSLIEGWRYVSK